MQTKLKRRQKTIKADYQYAKKSLGQNFLTDISVLKKIVRAVDIKKGDVVVEIGPGHGELTKYLLEAKPTRLILIEKDGRLIGGLHKKFQNTNHKKQTSNKTQIPNIEIIDGDVLDIIENWKLKIGNSTSYKLVGNIPYYITGHLLRLIGEQITSGKSQITKIVLTVQKEVAERICAKPPKMNILAASVQFWGKPEIISIIPREKFNPAPKIDSAIIKIVPVKSRWPNIDGQNFYKLIKVLFKQPRKTIWNNLKQLTLRQAQGKQFTEERLKKLLIQLEINPEDRPQNLSIDKITDLNSVIWQ
ncbi:MAG TPA: 16S rRNA (adenine(1518)-N(6)/adenine(1519)-N(6))-dimethyltransferase RsmA [Candidatus Paceibacterota bacterium]